MREGDGAWLTSSGAVAPGARTLRPRSRLEPIPSGLRRGNAEKFVRRSSSWSAAPGRRTPRRILVLFASPRCNGFQSLTFGRAPGRTGADRAASPLDAIYRCQRRQNAYREFAWAAAEERSPLRGFDVHRGGRHFVGRVFGRVVDRKSPSVAEQGDDASQRRPCRPGGLHKVG